MSSAVLRELHTPQMVIRGGGGGGGGGQGDGVARLNAYGLGWFITDYRGRVQWDHGGNTDGMTKRASVGAWLSPMSDCIQADVGVRLPPALNRSMAVAGVHSENQLQPSPWRSTPW